MTKVVQLPKLQVLIITFGHLAMEAIQGTYNVRVPRLINNRYQEPVKLPLGSALTFEIKDCFCEMHGLHECFCHSSL